MKLLAVTACPTGIAHTYMAAEKLSQTAERLGVDIKVETQGSIGAENVLTDNDVSTADGVIIAADKDVDLSRFAGKRVVTAGVAEGPVNKTAFLFGAGLIATGNQDVMGMCAAAIPVMPLGQGLATLVRKRLYTEQERETGLASLFMGLFGISEGAIPFAAARPAQVIPANMLGGAVAGAIAGLAGVEDAVPHGGPIVAVLGAVSGVPMFFVAVVIGTVVTAATTVALVDFGERRRDGGQRPLIDGFPAQAESALAGVGVGGGAVTRAGGTRSADSTSTSKSTSEPVAAESVATESVAAESTSESVTESVTESADGVPAAVEGLADSPADGPATPSDAPGADAVLSGYLTAETVRIRLDSDDKESAIREMAGLLAATGKVADVEELVRTALRREEQGTTGLGEEIAVPHAKTDAVTAPLVGFARSVEGIEWGSLDGTKAKLVFMISVPEAAAGDEHLRILALLSRKLMDAGFRERLTAAPDEAAVLGVLREIR